MHQHNDLNIVSGFLEALQDRIYELALIAAHGGKRNEKACFLHLSNINEPMINRFKLELRKYVACRHSMVFMNQGWTLLRIHLLIIFFLTDLNDIIGLQSDNDPEQEIRYIKHVHHFPFTSVSK